MIQHIKPDASKIPGFYEPEINFSLMDIHNHQPIEVISNFLTGSDCDKLIELFNTAPVKEAVSIQGIKDVPSDKGSERTTMWSESLANMLYKKLLLTRFNPFLSTDKYSRTDSFQQLEHSNNTWSLCGISPLLRFMSYEDGGEHYSHYDAGFIYPDSDYRTLKSIVIYLTTNSSGATRFIYDDQDSIPQADRENSDWIRRATEREAYIHSYPVKGNLLVFDHRLCHDVSQFEPANKNEKRIIIRGDLIYKRDDK